MPTISMFYGILVLMFFRDNRRHHLPHIHVRYQGDEAASRLKTVQCSMVLCPRNNSRWFKLGLKSTKKNFLSTGNLLTTLLRTKEIVVAHADTVWQALRLFKEGKADFADCLIERFAKEAGCDYTATFDRDAARHCGMRLVG